MSAVTPSRKKTTRLQNHVVFVDPDPSDLYLGMAPLKDHLKQLKQTSPLIIRSFLSDHEQMVNSGRTVQSGILSEFTVIKGRLV